MSKFRDIVEGAVEGVKTPVKKVGEAVGAKSPFEALQKEKEMGPALHADVLAALEQIYSKNGNLKKVLDESAGFAVVPAIGRASLVLGGAYGIGEVFKGERVIGYAAIVELTLGVQVGGTTFHEIVVFHDEGALKRFKEGKYAFAADAAVEIVKAGAQGTKGFGGGSSIYVFDEGGMLLDLAIGGQKFIYRQAGLGRLRTTEGALDEDDETEDAGLQPQDEEEEPADTEEESGQLEDGEEEPADTEEEPGQLEDEEEEPAKTKRVPRKRTAKRTVDTLRDSVTRRRGTSTDSPK